MGEGEGVMAEKRLRLKKEKEHYVHSTVSCIAVQCEIIELGWAGCGPRHLNALAKGGYYCLLLWLGLLLLQPSLYNLEVRPGSS